MLHGRLLLQLPQQQRVLAQALDRLQQASERMNLLDDQSRGRTFIMKERMSRPRHSGRAEVYSEKEAKGSLFMHLATMADASASFTVY